MPKPEYLEPARVVPSDDLFDAMDDVGEWAESHPAINRNISQQQENEE